jgi:septal ring factor EnvC (AmiA/AmiB activator)
MITKLQILVETNEKEIQRLQEQLASLRTDKDALEATLFDSQTNLETLDARRILLEREQQELLITQVLMFFILKQRSFLWETQYIRAHIFNLAAQTNQIFLSKVQ